MMSSLVALWLFTFVTASTHAFKAVGHARLDVHQTVLTRAASAAGSNSGRLEPRLSFFRTVEVQSRRFHPNERRSGFSTGTALLLFNSDKSFDMLVSMNATLLKMSEDMGQVKATFTSTSKKIDELDKKLGKLVIQAEQSNERREGMAKILELRAAQSKEHNEGLVKILEMQADQSKERDEGLAKSIKNLEKLVIASQQYQRAAAAHMSTKSSTEDKTPSEADTTHMTSEDTNEKMASTFGWKKIFAPFSILVSKLVTSLSNAWFK